MSLRRELSRLARFGANIADAYSCFIFLPAHVLAKDEEKGAPRSSFEYLGLAGVHSLSNDVIANPTLDAHSGLIGWVATHGRSTHVSPFGRDSRTLGVYKSDQELKSFIAVPIPLAACDGPKAHGVLACDSKKSFAFSKLQGKLLEELALEVGSLVSILAQGSTGHTQSSSWQDFLRLAGTFAHTVGHASVEALRIRVTNYDQLELKLGTGQAVALVDRVMRLIVQTIPPHFPNFRGPTGELLIISDNMLSAFLENKVQALCAHAAFGGARVECRFSRRAFHPKIDKQFSIEHLISESAFRDSLPDPGSDARGGLRKALGFS